MNLGGFDDNYVAVIFFTPYQPSRLGTWVAFSAFCVQNGMHASPSNSQLRIAEAIY